MEKCILSDGQGTDRLPNLGVRSTFCCMVSLGSLMGGHSFYLARRRCTGNKNPVAAAPSVLDSLVWTGPVQSRPLVFLDFTKTVCPIRGFPGRGWTAVDRSRLPKPEYSSTYAT